MFQPHSDLWPFGFQGEFLRPFQDHDGGLRKNVFQPEGLKVVKTLHAIQIAVKHFPARSVFMQQREGRAGHFILFRRVQAAYHIYKRGNFDVAPFVRYERIDIKQAEDPADGLFQDPRNNERIKTIGVNFWVHPQVVLKADVQRYETDKTQDAYRLGLGFMF